MLPLAPALQDLRAAYATSISNLQGAFLNLADAGPTRIASALEIRAALSGEQALQSVWRTLRACGTLWAVEWPTYLPLAYEKEKLYAVGW